MPLYEYKCGSCGEVLEVRQKFSDQPLTVHDKCGGSLEKLISRSSLQFKGTGWYVTDYAKGNGKKAPAKDSQTESSGDKSSGDQKSQASTGENSTSKSGKSDKGDKPSVDKPKAGKASTSSSSATPASSSEKK